MKRGQIEFLVCKIILKKWLEAACRAQVLDVFGQHPYECDYWTMQHLKFGAFGYFY